MSRTRRGARGLLLGTVMAAVLLLAPAARPQQPERPTPESFTIEWRATTEPWRRPALEGYVYNHSRYRVGNVRLRVETLDGEDRVVGERFAWVYGNIPAGSRWYFSVPLPRDGQRFRLSVASFHLIAVESP
ncbi:MAG TPA: FxLYD domain-containing protein [Candidatus Tectomicrobia bacterium]|nr:FxLYD domain-containing protein [Candidatus Tectomicrobia bacterium]